MIAFNLKSIEMENMTPGDDMFLLALIKKNNVILRPGNHASLQRAKSEAWARIVDGMRIRTGVPYEVSQLKNRLKCIKRKEMAKNFGFSEDEDNLPSPSVSEVETGTDYIIVTGDVDSYDEAMTDPEALKNEYDEPRETCNSSIEAYDKEGNSSSKRGNTVTDRLMEMSQEKQQLETKYLATMVSAEQIRKKCEEAKYKNERLRRMKLELKIQYYKKKIRELSDT